MSAQNTRNDLHSQSWVTFTYATFVGALGMVAAGILFAPVELWVKAYFAMGAALLVQSTITMTKTVRDVHGNRARQGLKHVAPAVPTQSTALSSRTTHRSRVYPRPALNRLKSPTADLIGSFRHQLSARPVHDRCSGQAALWVPALASLGLG